MGLLRHRELAVGALLAVALATVGVMAVAGPLSPPAGAVSSTYKTLTEVEPRIAINATNTPGDADSLFKITQPGSYYLTGNVAGVAGKSGIEVTVGGVIIDLSGFELVGQSGGTAHGIASTSTGLANITVRNGTIRNWTGSGIYLSNIIASGGAVTDIDARDNGANGIFVHSYYQVTHCTASGNGANGIWAVNSSLVSDCTAFGNGGDGIQVGSGHTINLCISYGNSGFGIRASDAAIVTNCSSYNNTSGVFVSSGGTVTGCMVRTNDADGIVAGAACSVVQNTCTNNGFQAGDGSGIYVQGSDGCVENNLCSGNDRGVKVDGSRNRVDGNSCTANSVSFVINGADNLIIRNVATGGSPNYSIVAGNSVAPRVSVADSDGWASISNAGHPWANLGY